MLTLPDFEEKKIVFVASKDFLPNVFKFRNSNIRLYRNGEFVDQISCHLVLSLFIIGETTLTSVLIRKARQYGISIFMLNYSFKTYATIMSQAEGNYKLRQVQYLKEKEESLEIAKRLVENKIENQAIVACSYKKKVSCGNKLRKQIRSAENTKKLLGTEGNFAGKYFPTMFSGIGWYRRAPRTKEDIPNLLLDIGYSFLFNYVDSLLRLFGFDTYKGFYHRLFFQRQSLACDIMEPMRPIIDRQLVKSYHLKQINEKDFRFQNGSFKLKNNFQKKYADIWFRTIVAHKTKIYNFILGFYRYLLNPINYKFPVFKIQC